MNGFFGLDWTQVFQSTGFSENAERDIRNYLGTEWIQQYAHGIL